MTELLSGSGRHNIAMMMPWTLTGVKDTKDASGRTREKSGSGAKRPCDCSVLYLCLISSLCSCPDCILDITSFGSADSVHHASNNRVVQFTPVFQVEGNTFRPIYFGYFITDWILYNWADRSFHTTKLCSRLYSNEVHFYSKKRKKSPFEPPFLDLGVT